MSMFDFGTLAVGTALAFPFSLGGAAGIDHPSPTPGTPGAGSTGSIRQENPVGGPRVGLDIGTRIVVSFTDPPSHVRMTLQLGAIATTAIAIFHDGRPPSLTSVMKQPDGFAIYKEDGPISAVILEHPSREAVLLTVEWL